MFARALVPPPHPEPRGKRDAPRTRLLRPLAWGTLALAACGCQRVDTVIAEWQEPTLSQPSGPDASAVAGSTNQSLPDAASSAGAGPALDSGAAFDAGAADAFYLEAEAGELSGTMAIGQSEFASGGEFIVDTGDVISDDMPGSGLATYSFSTSSAGQYILWGRIHSPDAEHNRFWLRMDDGAWVLWRISTGEAWFWDDIHNDTDYSNPIVFELAQGSHSLDFASASPGAELDRLYITARGDVPPGNDTPCNPPHSIEVAGECQPSCGSHGNVSCFPDECAGKEMLQAYDCPVCCAL